MAATAGRPVGRPRKDKTAAATDAGVKKTTPKKAATGRPRGRPAGSATKTKAAAPKTSAALASSPKKRGPKAKAVKADASPSKAATGKPRGRPAGSKNKTTAQTAATGLSKPKAAAQRAAAKVQEPAVPATESTAGADRRRERSKGQKFEMLPAVKKRAKAGPNDKRRKPMKKRQSVPTAVANEDPIADHDDGFDHESDAAVNAVNNDEMKGSPANANLMSGIKGIFG